MQCHKEDEEADGAVGGAAEVLEVFVLGGDWRGRGAFISAAHN